MARVTRAGIEALTLSEHLTEMRGALREVFGQRVDVSDESPQMQFMSLFSLGLTQSDEGVVALQNALDINTAIGLQLDVLGALLFLPRKGATRTTFTQQVRGTSGTVIYAGSIAAAANDNLFEVASDVMIGTDGTATPTWRSLFDGDISAAPLVRVVTTITGWDGMVAAADSPLGSIAVGRLRETDADYRIRLRNTCLLYTSPSPRDS